jgi:uncharacterized protein
MRSWRCHTAGWSSLGEFIPIGAGAEAGDEAGRSKMGRPSAGVSLITLGVRDLEKSLSFYTGLGWADTRHSQESVKFLAGHNVVLGLFGRASLAEDARVDDTATGFAAIALAVNLPTIQAVDSYFSRAIAAGASVSKKPEKVFWGGYSGYFTDPDGHLWEVAHNPYFAMDEYGKLDLQNEGVQ